MGIVLFLVEIVFFIALPVAREIGAWWQLRERLRRTRRAALTGGAVLALACLLFVPWSTRIDVPAVLEWRDPVRLYPARAARVASVQAAQGQDLAAGDKVVTLEVPEIASQIAQTRTRLDLTRLRLARRMADDQDREQSLVLEDEMRSLQTRLAGFEQERDLLTMRMPVSGRLLELNPALHAGRWVSKTEPIATIGKPGHWIVRGYVGESDLRRLPLGALGTFVAHETLLRAFQVALGEISQAGAASIELPELMSVHGGAIAVEEDRTRRLVPVSAQFLVTLRPVGTVPPVDRIVRGTVVLHGEAESFAVRAWRQVVTVLVREMGF